MLTHFLVYFTFATLYLFPGVSAAVIGSPPDLNSRHISSLNERDDDQHQNQNDNNLPREIEDVLPHATQDQVVRLMSEIPDEVLGQGTDATEDWLRERLQSSSIATRDSDADNAELAERDWIDTFFKKTRATIRCGAGLVWAVTWGTTPAASVGKAQKIKELKEAIDDVGGYKKAAEIIVTKEESDNFEGHNIEDLLYEIFSNDWVKDNCHKVA